MSTPLINHPGYTKLKHRFPGFVLTYSGFVNGVYTIQLKLPDGGTINDYIKVKQTHKRFDCCVRLIKRNLRKYYRGKRQVSVI